MNNPSAKTSQRYSKSQSLASKYMRIGLLATLLSSVSACSGQFGGAAALTSKRFYKEDNADEAILRIAGALSGASAEETIESAIDRFYESDYTPQSRNRVQDYLIGYSNIKCREYEAKIQQDQSNPNFIAGALTTGIAGAGAIVSAETLSRAFSGSAAVLSGVRSEYNEVYFRQKTIEVITRAIRNRREKILNDIDKKRTNNTEITDYTMERAIADAIEYNNACSFIAGLEEINENIDSLAGLKELNRVLELLNGSTIQNTGEQLGGAAQQEGATEGEAEAAPSGGTLDRKLSTLKRVLKKGLNRGD